MWEGLVDFGANVFENDDKDQVAARVPFSGSLENPKTGIFQAIISVLRNAFVGAFANSLEGSISLRDVKGELRGYDLSEGKQQKEDAKGKDGEEESASRRKQAADVQPGPRART
jgi:hypothetical protein